MIESSEEQVIRLTPPEPKGDVAQTSLPSTHAVVPNRVQLRRIKGWRMPPNTVKVDRGTMWGNWAAWRVGAKGDAAVKEFEDWIEIEASEAWKGRVGIDLRGKNLACWCALDKPCHADVLLRLANESHGRVRPK